MFAPKRIHPLTLAVATALVVFCSACKKAPDTRTTAGTSPAAAESTQNPAVQTEVIAPQLIAGSIRATGKILVSEDRVASIGPVHEGRLMRLYAGQGSVVTKGQKLADLQSADIDEAEADYLKALAEYDNARRTSEAEVKLAQQTYDRTKMLFEKTIAPGKALQAAEHDLQVAKVAAESSVASTRAAVTSARHKLMILGIKESDLSQLANKPDVSAVFSLTAPISGIVVERNATVGATVGSDANVFKIVDISSVWIDANVFEKDLARVRLGQPVNVSVTAFPTVFAGKVIFVSTVVDPDTRSVKVRTEVPNRDGKLKPDMFANVEIVTDVNRTAISIPQSALLNDGGQSIVFVASGAAFEKRIVTTGIQSEDRVEIVSGLKTGDKVVIKGNYLLLQQSKPEQ